MNTRFIRSAIRPLIRPPRPDVLRKARQRPVRSPGKPELTPFAGVSLGRVAAVRASEEVRHDRQQ